MSENIKLVDKYRPKNWDEMVGQTKIITQIKAIADKHGPYPHFLFVGPAGSGKTVTAEIFAKATGYDVHEFNASDDRTLVFIRDKIKSLSQFSGRRIIILDEATSALDEESEQMIKLTMKELKGQKTLLIISHRPTMLQYADRIIAIENREVHELAAYTRSIHGTQVNPQK